MSYSQKGNAEIQNVELLDKMIKCSLVVSYWIKCWFYYTGLDVVHAGNIILVL